MKQKIQENLNELHMQMLGATGAKPKKKSIKTEEELSAGVFQQPKTGVIKSLFCIEKRIKLFFAPP